MPMNVPMKIIDIVLKCIVECCLDNKNQLHREYVQLIADILESRHISRTDFYCSLRYAEIHDMIIIDKKKLTLHLTAFGEDYYWMFIKK